MRVPFVALLCCAATVFGCAQPEVQDVAEPVPSEAIIDMLRQEPIIHFVPDGVVEKGLVEMPAEGIDISNEISQKFIASDDSTLMNACEQCFQAAVNGGWTGPDLADKTSSGIVSSELSKGDLNLTINCVTSRSFDLLENDRNEIRLSVEISTQSTSGPVSDDDSN